MKQNLQDHFNKTKEDLQTPSKPLRGILICLAICLLAIAVAGVGDSPLKVPIGAAGTGAIGALMGYRGGINWGNVLIASVIGAVFFLAIQWWG
jgi:hypothetical protein